MYDVAFFTWPGGSWYGEKKIENTTSSQYPLGYSPIITRESEYLKIKPNKIFSEVLHSPHF